MISNEQCKKILNKGNRKYTDEQVNAIREYLMKIAKLNVAIINNTKTIKDEESSDNV